MYKNLSKATILLMLAGTASCFNSNEGSTTNTRRGAQRSAVDTVADLFKAVGNGEDLSQEDLLKLVEQFEQLKEDNKLENVKSSEQRALLEAALDTIIGVKEQMKEGKLNKSQKGEIIEELYARIDNISEVVDEELFTERKAVKAEARNIEIMKALSDVKRRLSSTNLVGKPKTKKQKVAILEDFMNSLTVEDTIFSEKSKIEAIDALLGIAPSVDIDTDNSFEEKTDADKLTTLETAFDSICGNENHEMFKTTYTDSVITQAKVSVENEIKGAVEAISEKYAGKLEEGKMKTNSVAKHMKAMLKKVLNTDLDKLGANEKASIEKAQDALTANSPKDLKGKTVFQLAEEFEKLNGALGTTFDSKVMTAMKQEAVKTVTLDYTVDESILALTIGYRDLKEKIAAAGNIPKPEDYVRKNKNGDDVVNKDGVTILDEKAYQAALGEYYLQLKVGKRLAEDFSKLSKVMKKKNATAFKDLEANNKAFQALIVAAEDAKTKSKNKVLEIKTKAEGLRDALRSFLTSTYPEIYGVAS